MDLVFHGKEQLALQVLNKNLRGKLESQQQKVVCIEK